MPILQKFYSRKISGHWVPATKNKNRIFLNLHRVYPAGVDRSRQAGIYKGDMERGLVPMQKWKATPAAIARLHPQRWRCPRL
jgi:hypothetical protein